MIKQTTIFFLSFIILLTFGTTAQAYEGFGLLPDRCNSFFSLYEKKFSIPRHLLRAISIQESGRKLSEHRDRMPWPWTINVHGEGYYFESEQEAIQKVKTLQGQGIKSIDVGCMQVNLKHHPKAFRNVEQAFEPQYNVAYAAKLLRSHYDRFGNWDIAVANYHNAEERLGWVYLRRVQKVLQDIQHRPSYRERAYFTPPSNVYAPVSYEAMPHAGQGVILLPGRKPI